MPLHMDCVRVTTTPPPVEYCASSEITVLPCLQSTTPKYPEVEPQNCQLYSKNIICFFFQLNLHSFVFPSPSFHPEDVRSRHWQLNIKTILVSHQLKFNEKARKQSTQETCLPSESQHTR